MTPEQALSRAARRPVTHEFLADLVEGLGKAIREQIAAATAPLAERCDLLESRQRVHREVVDVVREHCEVLARRQLFMQREALEQSHGALEDSEQ